MPQCGIRASAYNGRTIKNFKELGIYLGVILAVLGLILLNNPFIMLIVGFASAIGVMLVLAMVMSVMFMTITRTDRTYHHWSELWLPMLVGLTAAIVMIGGIDALRYMFTGSWDGFVFVTQE